MKVLHFDCFAGISGDMVLGALVDLGLDPGALREELGKLGLAGWKLNFTRDERCGINGTRAIVDLGDRHDHHAPEEEAPAGESGSRGDHHEQHEHPHEHHEDHHEHHEHPHGHHEDHHEHPHEHHHEQHEHHHEQHEHHHEQHEHHHEQHEHHHEQHEHHHEQHEHPHEQHEHHHEQHEHHHEQHEHHHEQHEQPHEQPHEQHEHHHEHPHDHHEHPHEHGHHSWKEIRELIKNSAVREGAKRRALDIFSRIAGAEAQVHGMAEEEVTFHEVGAMDSIIDIVGAAVGLDLLGPDRITASEVELGGGTVHCAHGVLPVPAPATLILCRGMPVKTGGFQKEMTTPTGAGILASCVDEFISGGSFVELKTGYGIGARRLDKPNVLRVSWREAGAGGEVPLRRGDRGEQSPWNEEELTVMEANIDDMGGEALGFLMESLFARGALDVSFIPCTMKKSRPGTLVTVLGRPEKLDALRRTLFQRSTTIGFREQRVRRVSLRREEDRLTGNFGEARLKKVFLGDRELRSKIEYEDRARIARERGVSLEEAERIITEEGLHG